MANGLVRMISMNASTSAPKHGINDLRGCWNCSAELDPSQDYAHVRIRTDKGTVVDHSVGWRLASLADAVTPDLSLSVLAKQRETATAPTDHGIALRIKARW